MENEFKRIVEINGVKIEVDLRTAKRVDEFKVGSYIKILKKEYSSYQSHFGMIVGFDEFKMLPTIIVAWLSQSNWDDPLQFSYINAESKDIEICAVQESDFSLKKGDILEHFQRKINKSKQEIQDIEMKRDYFIKMFGKYFEQLKVSDVC